MAWGKGLLDLYRGFRQHPRPLEKPVVLQFPVNDICNARCQMCNIWKQKLGDQISPADLTQALENSLFEQVRSVGINGGEPTLRRDIAALVEVLFRKLPKLKQVSLITNALDSDRVIASIEDVGQVVREHGGSLDVMVSLDGVGEVHNRVRGRLGAFENAVRVIDFIRRSDLVACARLGCTVIRENVYGLHDLLDFAIDRDIYIKFRLGVPHRRLYNEELAARFSLNFEEKVHFGVFLEGLIRCYETSGPQSFFYRSLIDQMLHGKPRQAGCDWQHRGVTLSSRGELLYCAVESDVLGSAVSGDAEQIYFGNVASLQKIVGSRCADCAHDYVGLMPAELALKERLEQVADRFPFPLGLMRAAVQSPPVKRLRRRRAFAARLDKFGVGGSDRGSAPSFRSPATSRQPRRVMICGWYGTETLGDKAILGGVLKAIRGALGDVVFILVSLEPYISEMTALQMPELSDTTICSVDEGIALAGTVDLVAFGGGPIMALDNLAEMIAIFEKAAGHGVPTLLAGCGVGPLGAPHHNRAIKKLLELSSLRVYRDANSRRVAADLGVDTTTDLVAEDPAFTWLEGKAEGVAAGRDEREGAEVKVLLGLRDWPYREYAPELSVAEGEAIKERFEATLVEGLERLIDRHPGIKLIPFPMCTNHIGSDDRWYYRRLFRDRPRITEALDYSTLSRELSPDEACAVFHQADAALPMRFHSLVFALGFGVPSVAIDYTLGRGKVASLAETHEVFCCSLDRIGPEFIADGLDGLLRNGGGRPRRGPEMPSPFFPQAVKSSLERLS